MVLPNFQMLFFIQLFLCLLMGCSSDNKTTTLKHPKADKFFTLNEPKLNQVFNFNDSINFSLKLAKNNLVTDSVIVYINGKKQALESISPLSFSRKNIFKETGRQDLRIRVCYNDSLSQTIAVNITVLSDIEPENLSYKVVRKIPHDPNAYTQGLFYYKGILYESTGLKRQSRLLKIDPSNGTVIFERHLGDDFFGEGITRWNNQIFQLTYEQKVGFVYDIESFEQLREFELQTMEGWGLTNNDENLIVSDGSSVIYFYDPEYFSQTDQLEVCDNRGLVTRLNELEYTEGNIWANIYGESYIIKIDANTGKVLAKLDLEELYPEGIPHDLDHVLNGIARSESNTYFVTGKFWPVMYEIAISK